MLEPETCVNRSGGQCHSFHNQRRHDRDGPLGSNASVMSSCRVNSQETLPGEQGGTARRDHSGHLRRPWGRKQVRMKGGGTFVLKSQAALFWWLFRFNFAPSSDPLLPNRATLTQTFGESIEAAKTQNPFSCKTFEQSCFACSHVVYYFFYRWIMQWILQPVLRGARTKVSNGCFSLTRFSLLAFVLAFKKVLFLWKQ